jgi:Raf kinase inhibitor-like YbhB/YbcL family protein
MTLELTSPVLRQGDRVPDGFTCVGKDISPPLAWSNAPRGTRSWALFCDDPDAPTGTWRHWCVFDLPASIHSLPEGWTPIGVTAGALQGRNDFRRIGYGGPCPPVGHGVHRYRFRIIALRVETLGLPDRASCREVEEAAEDLALEEAVLVATFSR